MLARSWGSEAPGTGVAEEGGWGPAELPSKAAAETHDTVVAQTNVPLLFHRLVSCQ